ncbi:unnamed protein product [Acanthocheilonema viteae]|uniref:Innexin n=1 Tax=Acanthocheilonema viteae TaxID=6277 RepID=A0A498SLJ7_ACAVI|nr:unnamed protein product [Acanthocheilonema viteae]
MIQNFDKYLQSLKPKYDDDVVDRCNYLITNIMLLICAITVAAKQYVGEPLQCWVPAEFQNGWEQYIENFCFVENTYFLPFADDIPTDVSKRDQYQIQYYQWTPFILTLQALLFLVPRTIWTMFNWRTGLNMQAIVDAAILTKKVGKKRHLKKITKNRDDLFAQAQQITYVMDFNRRKSQYGKFMAPPQQIYVTMLYLFCKCLNVLNIIVQLYLLNRFLGMQYYLWGFGVLNDLIHGREWSISGNFPRDAITVLHLVSDNAGEMVAADLLAALWHIYQNRKDEKKIQD